MTDTAISVRGLTKRFGSFAAVDGVTFDVPTGQVVGFLGPNGAGKTTTIRMLLGMVTPSGGDASILGHPISSPAEYLPRVGSLIEGPAFYPYLSGARNLLLQCRQRGLPAGRVGEVLEQVGLHRWGGTKVKDYSLGMKQRLAIAAALLPDPDLLEGAIESGVRRLRPVLRPTARHGGDLRRHGHRGGAVRDDGVHGAFDVVPVDAVGAG